MWWVYLGDFVMLGKNSISSTPFASSFHNHKINKGKKTITIKFLKKSLSTQLFSEDLQVLILMKVISWLYARWLVWDGHQVRQRGHGSLHSTVSIRLGAENMYCTRGILVPQIFPLFNYIPIRTSSWLRGISKNVYRSVETLISCSILINLRQWKSSIGGNFTLAWYHALQDLASFGSITIY